MNRVKNIIVLIFLFWCMTASAIPAKPSVPRLVNDLAGLFDARQEQRLESLLVSFDDSTSNQITVVTVTDLEGYSAMEYATRIGLSWQVGSEKSDNGIVVLVKPKTASSKGEVAISVGYGLEGAIPDAYVKRIIEGEIIPKFKENDYFGGVAAGCDVLMQLASGEISEPRDGETGIVIPLIMMLSGIFVVLIILAIGNGKNGGGGYRNSDDDVARAIIIGSIIGSGSRSSSSWQSGFGGFSGGGFGGFGGGSFGGGGASGSW